MRLALCGTRWAHRLRSGTPPVTHKDSTTPPTGPADGHKTPRGTTGSLNQAERVDAPRRSGRRPTPSSSSGDPERGRYSPTMAA